MATGASGIPSATGRHIPEGADQRHSISPDPMDEQMTEEEEEEEEKGQRDTQSEEEDKFKLTKIQMACLDFCIELLNQRVQVEDYECALVDTLAVLGRGEYGWRDAESYPPMLSRIIKVARFMVVHKALRLDANASDMLARNQASQMVGEWAVVSPMEEADYTFTGNQNEGPMQWMLDLRTYGLRVHYSNTTPGHVGWMGGDELLYKDMHFTMGDFRGFTHGLVGATRRILREELLFENELNGQQPPAIPWSTMRDDPTQGGTGWNFLKDSRTRWPAINAYLRWVVRFREKLSVAVHVTAGQPARAPELLSVRPINTENGGHRNIFIEDGMVVFVTRYHKGFHASNDIKVIHRYLPREVGELVVWYLWLVLPFAQRLQEYRRRIREEEGNPEEENANQRGTYMWGGDPDGRAWTSERFREVLKRETRIGLHGQGLNLAAYRNIAIAISRQFMRPSSAFKNNSQQEEEEQVAGSNGDEDEPMDPEEWLGRITDMQAAHTSHVAGMVYARGITEQAGTTHRRREMFRLSSTDWHRFLGFESATTEKTTRDAVLGKRKRAPWETEAEEGRMERRFQLQQTDMEAELQRMMGDKALKFRGVQAAAIRAIQDGESPVVAIMPTGGGKSMMFMLPAWVAPGGTTVVVVPLVALRGDMQRRCEELGISCVEWESRRPPDEASMVLVTPESALSEDFITFLNRQRLNHRLDRIVIDECHTVLNDQVNFRPQMQQLGKLMAAKTQMVLLTATLPPGEEEKLWSRMHCTRADISLFRARTCRPNVAYRVWQPIIEGSEYGGLNRWFQAPSVVRFIQDRMRRTGEGKGVVYCQTVNQVTTMASALGCEAYHHHQIDKAGILERFRQGQYQVIVATSALGMGIDIPNIRSIIHVGRPRSLLDYGQESGRAGRDGQSSEAIIIEPEGISAAMIWSRKDAPSLLDQKLVERYMQAGGEGGDEPMARCRRVVLDRYLDGEVEGYMRRHCGDRHTGESQCDGCDAEWEAREAVFTPSPGGTPTPTPSPGYSSRATAKDDSSEDETSQESEMESQQGETHIRFNGTCSPRMARSVSKSTDDNINESITKNEASTSGGSSPGQWNKQESSEISEDTRGIPSTTRQTFHKQDVRRGRFIITHQQRGQRALMDEEVLVEEAQRWKDQCLICASGKREFDHELYQCPHEESQEAKRWMMTVRSKIKYTRYSGCFRCGMPQSICNSWKTQRQCPYRGFLIPTVAMMVYGCHAGQMKQAWRQRLREFNVDADDQEAVIEFLGQKVEGQGIEHNQLVEMFCWLRGIYQEAERGKMESEGTEVK
ncbi:conserved hypothetical protein [Histoplasma mississippiense (nom. inval.)]|uniref:conserved hypothetical protein n=1 Tax=Ajellomyces capsulatus (strain NAm1 / WU24) TaxID=2059318 RepID=UPI000157D365|nr:conserved hypothetical protein [Histoplasma mississippiense (nom. inval.)]EDN04941.1 conserved hypothetical protein [Histoplasma mississippiense (nom. inval.)]